MSSALRGRTVWVVGASGGIGAAVAKELVNRGARVAISARRTDRLREVAAGRMTVAEADVTDTSSLHAAADRVHCELGEIDLVIYSAGVWQQTDATAWDREVFARHVQVNLLGLNDLLDVVLPRMVDNGRGHVVGIASVAGYRGLAGAEAYGATKAAQINLLEALRTALRPHGVSVTTVCPGFVRTGLTAGNRFPMPFMIEPERAARSICDGLERGQMEIVFPLPMALLMKTARVLPVRAWTLLMTRHKKGSGALR